MLHIYLSLTHIHTLFKSTHKRGADILIHLIGGGETEREVRGAQRRREKEKTNRHAEREEEEEEVR